MISLSLMHWLLIGNMALMLGVGMFMLGLRRQQKRESRRLDEAVNHLRNSQQAMSKSTIGMGRKIRQLDSRVQGTERKVVLPSVDEASYQQASRLVRLGASASDLVDNCGMARGEAELLVSLKRQPQH